MSDSLFLRASQNFNEYLQMFQTQGVVKMLPASRLTSQEWNTLNEKLKPYNVIMVPVEKDGHKYMKFSKQVRNIVPTKLENKLKRYTNFDWEHRTADASGLGYEHYRLNIDNLSQIQIEAIKTALENRAIYVENVSTNKGRFLIFNVEKTLNLPPADYIASKEIFGKVYRVKKIPINEFVKKDLMDILATPLPVNDMFAYSPEMCEHTNKIIARYAKIGALSQHGIDSLSYDLRNVLMKEFAKLPNLSNAIINWQHLSKSSRIDAMKQMNYIIGSMHRKHIGNTVVNFGDKYRVNGGFNDEGSNSFSYKTLNLENFDLVLRTLIHENIHGFQSVGASSIDPEYNAYQKSNSDYSNRITYINILEEAEARYVATNVSRNFYNTFAQQKNTNNIYQNFDRFRD